jgi:hypothetical protein
MYMIEGGVYTDTDFATLEPGTQERYGPFTDYASALEEWGGRARAKIDICCHRLVIIQEPSQ